MKRPAAIAWSATRLRGPKGGPLAVAVVKAKDRDGSDHDIFEDMKTLVRHNVGGDPPPWGGQAAKTAGGQFDDVLRPASPPSPCRSGGPAVLVGDGDVFAQGEAVLAQAVDGLVVQFDVLVVVEEPALAATVQAAVGGVLVGSGNGAPRTRPWPWRRRPSPGGRPRSGRGQGVAPVVVPSRELGAGIAGQAHDDA